MSELGDQFLGIGAQMGDLLRGQEQREVAKTTGLEDAARVAKGMAEHGEELTPERRALIAALGGPAVEELLGEISTVPKEDDGQSAGGEVDDGSSQHPASEEFLPAPTAAPGAAEPWVYPASAAYPPSTSEARVLGGEAPAAHEAAPGAEQAQQQPPPEEYRSAITDALG